jgi:hypothetical protein
MGDTCPMIEYGPYLRGLSFLEGVLILRLRASNHTLLPGTKDLGGLRGLMHLCNAFCASVLDSCNCLRCSYAAGTESSGVLIDAVGLIPMISSCGVCFVYSCFHELCANSATGRRVLQLFCLPMTN